MDVLKEQVFGFWRSLHCFIKNKRFHSPSLPQKFKHNCVCTVFLLAFQGTLKVEVWEPRGVDPQKDGDRAYFCLSFVLALSLSSTNGSGSFLLSVTSSNKDCRKESCRDYINCYLHHKRLCKMRWCGHRCFKRIYRGDIDQEGGIFFKWNMSKLSFELLCLCTLIPPCLSFFSLFQLTGHIQRQTLAPQFSEWFVGCVAERQTEKRQLKKKHGAQTMCMEVFLPLQTSFIVYR